MMKKNKTTKVGDTTFEEMREKHKLAIDAEKTRKLKEFNVT